MTGEISGIIVVDADTQTGVERLAELTTDPTLVCTTGGGGKHYYFRHPGGKVPNAVRFEAGLDLRADGGIVIVPPSGHPTGGTYSWDTEFDTSIGYAPQAILANIQSSEKRKLDQDDWESDIEEGERDEQLTRRAGALFRSGLPAPEIETMLEAWNIRHCNPPLEAAQVHKIVMSVQKRFETGKGTRVRPGPKPAQATSDQFRTLSFAETLEEFGYRDEEWIIEDWLPKATCALVVAPPATYKTWMLLDLAVSVASGRPFLGRYPVLETGSVLVIQQEDPFPMLFSRLGSILHIKQDRRSKGDYILPLPPPQPEIFWHPDRQLNFGNTDSLFGLQEAIERIRPKMVMLDPLYSAVSSKDYMAEGAQDMLFLKRLRDQYGCAFVIAHHTTKHAGQTNREDIWGSQFLNAWLETGWQLRPSEGPTIKVKRHFKNSAGVSTLEMTFDITAWDFRVDEGPVLNEDIASKI